MIIIKTHSNKINNLIIKLLLSAVLILSSVQPVSAEFYRWVDEEGNTHISDQKPAPTENQEVKTIDPESLQVNTISEQASSKMNRQRMLNNFEQEAAYKRKEKTKRQKEEQKALKKCAKQRLELQKILDGWRFFTLNEAGEKTYMNEDQRKKRTETLQSALEKCL